MVQLRHLAVQEHLHLVRGAVLPITGHASRTLAARSVEAQSANAALLRVCVQLGVVDRDELADHFGVTAGEVALEAVEQGLVQVVHVIELVRVVDDVEDLVGELASFEAADRNEDDVDREQDPKLGLHEHPLEDGSLSVDLAFEQEEFHIEQVVNLLYYTERQVHAEKECAVAAPERHQYD